MIPHETRARIIRLHFGDGWPIGTIAKQLGVHHATVRAVLAKVGAPQALAPPRPSMADPFAPFIVQQLDKTPDLRASRLYDMVVERGYLGRPDHFRSIVACLRKPKPAEAFLRLRTLPGEQAQADWAHFGAMRVGNALRKLYAFVVVLAYSRFIFLRFGFDIGMAGFIRGHVQAFNHFDGVPRTILFDNLKSAVLERQGDAIRFNPTLLDLAAHYRFEPRPVAPCRGNEKGRVERAIQYIRRAFFAGRAFADLADLNRQAADWCQREADTRMCPEDRQMTVRAAFEVEQPRLRPLPSDDFPDLERVEVAVPKTPYVRFDLNDYSVPASFVRRRLTVVADLQRVRVVDGATLVADHPRSFDKGLQIEDQAHIAALVDRKRAARKDRAQDRVIATVPSAAALLSAWGQRGGNLGSAVAALGRLLDHYGAADLESAAAEALRADLPHPNAVRQIVERLRHDRGLLPPVAIAPPANPRARGIAVTPHALADYDAIARPAASPTQTEGNKDKP